MLLLLNLVAGLWGPLCAQTVTKNGIIYTITGENTASVTGTSTRLIGSKTVESQITRSGKTYQVKFISFQAFADQKYLRGLTLPESLDSIGVEAFLGCTILREIQGVKQVKHVGSYAFSGTSLTSADWSEWGLESVGHGSLSECTLLEEVKLPATLKSLPEALLSGCKKLKSLDLSGMSSLKTIEPRALAGCDSLTSLLLPSSLITIGDMAFDGLKSLEQLELPANVTNIGDFAFRYCTTLQEIVLPKRVTSLGVSPFYGCLSLKKVTLPDRLTSISGKYVFDHCPALESISISLLNTVYSSVDGVLYNRGKTQIVAYPAARSREVRPVLPNSSIPLDKGALADCELDEELWVPAKTTTISTDALFRTSGLKCLTTGEGSKLTTIEGWAAMKSRDLETIHLPATTTKIGESVFQGDDKIGHVIISASKPPQLDVTAFSDKTYSEAVLHVREGQSGSYQKAVGWMHFGTVEGDALTTGVEEAQDLAGDARQTEELYNLQGMRISNAAKAPKGIYIRNGKVKILR